MPRKHLPPRLTSRVDASGRSRWIIRDGQHYRRTPFYGEEQRANAEAALKSYVAKVYGPSKAALLPTVSEKVPVASRRESMVYFIGDGQAVKIGIAVNLQKRFAAIQAMCPQELRLYGTVPGGMEKERQLHCLFQDHRIRFEWFHLRGPVMDYVLGLPNLQPLAASFDAVDDPVDAATSVLSGAQVSMMRENPIGLSGSDFARLFGVGRSTVSEARSGKWWQHVT